MVKQLLSRKKVCHVKAVLEFSIVVSLVFMIFSCTVSDGDTSGISIDTDNVLTAEVYTSDSTKVESFSVRLTPLEQGDSVSYAIDSSETIEITGLTELTMSDLPMEDGKQYFIEIVPDAVPAPANGESQELADYGEVYWAGNVDRQDLEVILGNFIFLKEKGSLSGAIQVETIGSTWVGIDGTDAFFPIDSTGYFLIENIPEGEYELVILDIDPDSGSDIERLYSLTVIVDDQDIVVIDPVVFELGISSSSVSSSDSQSSSLVSSSDYQNSSLASSSDSQSSSLVSSSEHQSSAIAISLGLSSQILSSSAEKISSADLISSSIEISSVSSTLSSAVIETYDEIMAARQNFNSTDVLGLWYWLDDSTYREGNQTHRTDSITFYDNDYVYVNQWENDVVIKMVNGIWRAEGDKVIIEFRVCQELKTGSPVDVPCDLYNDFYAELFVSKGRLFQRTSKNELHRLRSITWGQEHLIQ